MKNNSKTAEVIQGNNQEAFKALKDLGYDLPAIRLALVPLNKTNIHELSERAGIAKSTFYNVIKGVSRNVDGIKGYAQELGLNAMDVFSDVLTIRI